MKSKSITEIIKTQLGFIAVCKDGTIFIHEEANGWVQIRNTKYAQERINIQYSDSRKYEMSQMETIK